MLDVDIKQIVLLKNQFIKLIESLYTVQLLCDHWTYWHHNLFSYSNSYDSIFFRMTCLIHNGTLRMFFWLKMNDISMFFSLKIYYCYCSISKKGTCGFSCPVRFLTSIAWILHICFVCASCSSTCSMYLFVLHALAHVQCIYMCLCFVL